ncbi:MAG: LacI family DNA-binding transcriptional regulator [Pseudomonadota bacterium]
MPDRPTTRDLAKAAGVSLATVDRVLNGRAGVRSKTVEVVNKTIQEIGFQRNVVAATLARRRAYRFAFVLPLQSGEFIGQLSLRIGEVARAFASEMIEAEVLTAPEDGPHGLARFLADLSVQAYDGIAIMAPETPHVRDAIRRVEERGIQAISFISRQAAAEDIPFVGIDNHAAGATAGELMGRLISPRQGSVIVLGESFQSRDSLERRLGFDRVMGDMFPHLTVLPSLETHGDEGRVRRVISQVLDARPDVAGIYVLASEARLPLTLAAELGGGRDIQRIAHERTPFTEAALREGRVEALITQDPGHLVRSAIRTLRARCENRTTLASQERIRIEVLLKHNL